MAIIIKKVKTNDAKQTFKLAKKKNQYDEYVIRCYQNGKYYEEGSYYTDDWDDAVGTLNDMARRQGLTVHNEGTTLVADSAISDETIRGHFVNAKISEWDPTTLIKRMKETRNGDMHTTLVDKKGNLHTVFLSAWGTTDKAEVWVDVVVETPQGKQDRVFMKKAASWDEALKMMQDYKRQHINDSKIKDDICSSENVKECVQDYRENAFGYDGIADYVQTNYPYHSKDEQDRLIAAMKKSMNDSKPMLDAAKAQQLVDMIKKAKAVNAIKDSDRLSKLAYELGQLANYFDRANSARSREYLAQNDAEMLNKFYNKGLETYSALKQEVEAMEKRTSSDAKYKFSFDSKTANLLSDAADRMHFIYRLLNDNSYKRFERLSTLIDEYTKKYRTLAVKDSAIKDKSFVEEIIALGREADNARWRFGGDSIDEAKIKKFITAATNSYRYIEQTFMSFMNEVNKNTDENGRWRNPTANIVSIWSNFSNEISSVKEASYRIIDVLDDIVASNHLPDSLKKQADILYRKYKDIYDRIFKSLKK